MASGSNASGDKKVPEAQKQSSTDPDETMSINLTDPVDVLDKLSVLELDEDETDELLRRAYEVNRELKKQLELGRLVMDHRMSASSAHPNDKSKHQRPGSNRISINMPPEGGLSREPTRMASASNSAHSRRSASTGLSSLVKKKDHPLKNYSYHSYTD